MTASSAVSSDELDARLALHLRHRLGSWPPPGASDAIEVVACGLRDEPEWDGVVRRVQGLRTPVGTVLSVSPSIFSYAAELAEGGLEQLRSGFGALIGLPGVPLTGGTFRCLGRLPDLEPLGEWLEPSDPRLPQWLAPFNGGVLAIFDDSGAYAAGVGLKRHDEFASEIAVGTEERHRGRGLARRLVATAVRTLVDQGVTATYEHAVSNQASAAVALACGFEDRGWRALHVGEEE